MFSKARSLKVIAFVAVLMLLSLTVVAVSAAPLWHTYISTTASAHANGAKAGFPVTDAITLTATDYGGYLNGVLTSYYCAASSCPSGGTLFWTSAPFTKSVPYNPGYTTDFTFVSGPFTPTTSGTYSFRSVYTPGPLIPPQSEPYPAVSDPGTGNEVFTIVPAYSIGNRVWFDANTKNNGILDSGEKGVSGVTMQLLSGYTNSTCSAGTVVTTTTTTDTNGYYRFDFSATGYYKVQVAASNFSGSGPLHLYSSSTGVFTGDSKDHGADTPVNGAIQSGCISITLNGEPKGETDLGPGDATAASDSNSDLTQDFGFYNANSTAVKLSSFSAQSDALDLNNLAVPDLAIAGLFALAGLLGVAYVVRPRS